MATGLTPHNTVIGTYWPSSERHRLAQTIATLVIGSLLITLCAKISLPVWPVPVTMQSFAVAAIAAACGLRIGVATVALYLLEGAIGLPVFATGGGLAYLAGPTGGFLLGFLVMAAVIGYAVDRGALAKPTHLFAALLAGDALLFVMGFVWLLAMAGQAGWIDQANIVQSAFAKAVQPFIVWDIAKMALAAVTVHGLWAFRSRV